MGSKRASSKKMNQRILADFVAHLAVQPWDVEAARQYGKIRTSLEKRGQAHRQYESANRCPCPESAVHPSEQ